MTDQEFIRAFEACTLPAERFDHQGHLRLAWLYLRDFPLAVAEQKTAEGIRRYATSLGAADKYHATVTGFLLRYLAALTRVFPAENWPEFRDQSASHFADTLGLLRQCYSAECLHSDEAKATYLEPDRRPLQDIVKDIGALAQS